MSPRKPMKMANSLKSISLSVRRRSFKKKGRRANVLINILKNGRRMMEAKACVCARSRTKLQ